MIVIDERPERGAGRNGIKAVEHRAEAGFLIHAEEGERDAERRQRAGEERSVGAFSKQLTREAKRRDEIKREIESLAESRDQYIKEQVEAAGGADDSLDEKIYRAVRDQAASIGLSYDGESAKY